MLWSSCVDDCKIKIKNYTSLVLGTCVFLCTKVWEDLHDYKTVIEIRGKDQSRVYNLTFINDVFLSRDLPFSHMDSRSGLGRRLVDIVESVSKGIETTQTKTSRTGNTSILYPHETDGNDFSLGVVTLVSSSYKREGFWHPIRPNVSYQVLVLVLVSVF